MAYDWISKHLYFVDGALSKIEVIRTNTKIPGHMRRTILGPNHLKKPRGIAVHPRVGYVNKSIVIVINYKKKLIYG